MNSTSQGSNAQSRVQDTARSEASKAADTIKREASSVVDEVISVGQEQAEQQFEQGKHKVEDQLDTFGSAVEQAADKLETQDHPLASYASDLSSQLNRLSSHIQSSSLDNLATGTRKLARENPGLFMLGSIALGFAASRFFKSTETAEVSASRSDAGQQHRALHEYQERLTPGNAGEHSRNQPSSSFDRDPARDTPADRQAPGADQTNRNDTDSQVYSAADEPRINKPVDDDLDKTEHSEKSNVSA